MAESVAAVDGKDIYTTIDSRIQSYLETLMDKVFKEYKPEDLTATLMNAKQEKSRRWHKGQPMILMI